MKLEGVKVLDLSLFLPGPWLSQCMADHGAEVIKVEPANGGEPNREIGATRDGITVFFANTHRHKKSLKLNLKTEEGVEVLLRLAEEADVFIEAFRPGVVDRLGVGYEQVRARAPHIVYLSISAFGQDGPYRTRPAHDAAVEAIGGALSTNIGPDYTPAMPGMANADMLSTAFGLSAVLMALLRRKDTGEGDYIDLAMLDTVLGAQPNCLGPVLAEKRVPDPKQERNWGGNAFYNIYQCQDGRHVVLGGAEMHFAKNMLEKLGRPDLVALCQPPPGPTQEPVRAFLRETFATRPMAEWLDFFADVDCSIAPVNDLREAVDDPQVRHRGLVVEDARGWEFLATPINFRNEPRQLEFDLPALGQHSREIVAGLGYDEAALAAMEEKGVF